MSFVSLLIWVQVGVNTLSSRKDISNDLREAIVATDQSGKDYKANSKLFGVRKIIHKWKTFKSVFALSSSGSLSQLIQMFDCAQGNCKKTKKTNNNKEHCKFVTIQFINQLDDYTSRQRLQTEKYQ